MKVLKAELKEDKYQSRKGHKKPKKRDSTSKKLSRALAKAFGQDAASTNSDDSKKSKKSQKNKTSKPKNSRVNTPVASGQDWMNNPTSNANNNESWANNNNSKDNEPFGQSNSNDPFGQDNDNDPFGQENNNDPFGQENNNDAFGEENNNNDGFNQGKNVNGAFSPGNNDNAKEDSDSSSSSSGDAAGQTKNNGFGETPSKSRKTSKHRQDVEVARADGKHPLYREYWQGQQNQGYGVHLPKQPLYFIPKGKVDKRVHHQVRGGHAEVTNIKMLSPQLIDSFDKPFAVFKFKYREPSKSYVCCLRSGPCLIQISNRSVKEEV